MTAQLPTTVLMVSSELCNRDLTVKVYSWFWPVLICIKGAGEGGGGGSMLVKHV